MGPPKWAPNKDLCARDDDVRTPVGVADTGQDQGGVQAKGPRGRPQRATAGLQALPPRSQGGSKAPRAFLPEAPEG